MTDRVRIVVKCPDCVETRIDSDDVTLRHCVDDESWSYRFVCPLCRRPAVSPTGRLAALDAMLIGCPLESWRLPAELLEHLGGPPLTLTDLSELRELLQEPGWFDDLAHSGREGQPR